MENISKLVLERASGKILGYVLDVCLDFQSMTKSGYVVVEEESENEFFLQMSDILKISDDFVLIEDVTVLQFVSAAQESLLGKIVVDENCQNFGHVIDLKFDKNKLEKIITNRCEIFAKNIKSVGADAIFVTNKRKIKTKKNIFKTLKSDGIVAKIQTKDEELFAPETVRLSANFYIGKQSSQDIFGYNHEKIVGKGENITKTVVEKARLHNKLNQLFFAIKR